MGFYLGIDLGTSYFKAGIFNEHGELIGLGRCFVEKQTDDEKICELSIVDFWATLSKCISLAIEKAGINPNKISSASYSSQANSFILLDETDNPLTPLILWPDKRAGQIPSALQSLTEKNNFLKKTGLGILPGNQSMAAKIIWVQKNKPDVWEKVKSIMSVSDYLTFSLTGKRVSDFSTSSMTGLFDVHEEKWWDEALESLNINKNFLNSPERTGSFAGALAGEKAKQLGLSARTKFFLGGLDHHMVAVGAGLPDSNNISESTGTVLACVNYQKGLNPKDGINAAPGLKKGHYFQMAFNENGATALEWYQKQFAPELSVKELLKMAENITPGSDGLKALPSVDKFKSLSGFRNIKKEHSHGHFTRAILESTSLSLRGLVNRLDKKKLLEALISSVRGARCQLWVQIKADLLNEIFVIPSCTELACQGAAFIGFMGVSENSDKIKSFKKQIKYAQIINPNPENVEKYKLKNKL